MMCSCPPREKPRGELDEASRGIDDDVFILSQLAAALLLGPQLAADTLPAIPGSSADAVVLTAACAGAGSAAGRSIFAVDMSGVSHWVVAHGRCSWGSERVTHRGACTVCVIGHCIATASVARCNSRGRQAGRSWLGVEAGVGEWTRVHESSSQRGWCRCTLVSRNVRRLVRAALLVAARRGSCNASVVALVAHDARVRALRTDRVQEGKKHALLHELVDLGNSLVECRRVRRNVGFRQG